MPALLHRVACCCVLLAPVLAQSDAAAQKRRWDDGGDLDKIVWHRPFTDAQRIARETGRVLLIKPILGGGNAPRPGGVPCGGKNDCEGSW